MGQTLNPLVEKAPSELNSERDTIIVYLLVLQCVGNSRKICTLEETWVMQQILHPSTWQGTGAVQTGFEPMPWE